MADDLNRPSLDPADNDSLSGLLRSAFGKLTQSMDDMLPARVVAFDRATNRAQVQPLVQVLTTDGQVVTRAQVASVPVLQIGGGGFVLNFPIKPGDLGWIKANDRDISLFLQSFAEAKPNTVRMHSFADGLFIPNILTGFTIAGEDADNVVLQTLDGSVRIAVWPGKVKITAPQLHIVADVLIEGDVTIEGGITSTGDIVAGGISLMTHVHTGVESGPSNTGGPV